MKKLAFAAAAVAAISSAPAFAADLRVGPTREPAYVAAPVAYWNGFYIGGQVGYQWGTNRQTEFVTATGVATGINPSWTTDGVVGGIHAGFNMQSGSFVYGVEADFEGSGVSGTVHQAVPFTSTSFNSRWQGSVRGRLGMAWGPTLAYVTGGVAFAELERGYFVGLGATETSRSTEAGWTVGVGLEYAFSPNWSTRIEYRYTDFGSVTHASLAAAPGFSYRDRADFHTVRAGVSWRFGGGPVVASY